MPSPLPEGEEPGREILSWVARQVDMGPRWPGGPAHRRLEETLRGELSRFADRVLLQPFELPPLPPQEGSGPVRCCNLVGVFQGAPGGNPLLLGTHYDTRLRADREHEPGRRNRPIPGANDGGSGTAVLLALLPWLRRRRLGRDVYVAFFDAEDVGDLAGLPFSVGARVFVARPPLPLPREALVLDMIGGASLSLDVDAHCLGHPPSLELTRRLFRLGRELGYRAFGGEKVRHIICDHLPFLRAGIASCLLIDLDYPQWHTQEDLPGAMSEASLAMISEVLRRYLQLPGW